MSFLYDAKMTKPGEKYSTAFPSIAEIERQGFVSVTADAIKAAGSRNHGFLLNLIRMIPGRRFSDRTNTPFFP